MLEKLNTWMVNVTLLTFPSLTLFVKPAASQILGFSLLWAIVLLFTTAPARNISPSEKLISRVFLIFILVAIASFVLKGVNYQGFKELGRYARFFAYLPLLVILIRSRASVVFFVGGLALGAFLSGAWALYAKYHLGYYRVEGDLNTILYGNFSIFYSVAVLLVGFYFCLSNRYITSLFLMLISLVGLSGAVMSGSRGGVIAFPLVICFGVFLLRGLKVGSSRQKKLLLISMIVFFIGSALLITNNDILKSRFAFVAEEISAYVPGKYHTGFGLRFDMWIMSLKAWADNPILGVGQGQYFDYAQQEAILNGGYHPYLIEAKFSQSHNEYFFAAASRGLLGVVSLLLIFIVPLWGFLAKAYRKLEAANNEIVCGGLVGGALVSMYMVFCLTESMFARSQAVSVFVFYVAACSYFVFSDHRKH